MSDEKDSVVLASRVLSHLKRSAGHGNKPNAEETKAAAIALRLLSITFPNFAGDPATLLEKLKQVSRKGGGSGEAGSANSAVNRQPLFESQQAMRKLNELQLMYEMTSKIMANAHEMKKSLVGNLR